jgi:vesicle transport protein SEC22
MQWLVQRNVAVEILESLFFFCVTQRHSFPGMLLTLIARVSDGLPLTASTDDAQSTSIPDYEKYRTQAKKIVSQLTMTSPSRLSIESGEVAFHCLLANGVVYLTMCEKGHSKKLAFAYLEELQREFNTLHGDKVATASKMYQFISFDSFMNKTKKIYASSRTQENLDFLNKELTDVHRIMTQSYDSLVHRGEKLENISQRSSQLSQDSKKYVGISKELNRMALYRRYAPFVVVGLLLVVLWYMRKWFQ